MASIIPEDGELQYKNLGQTDIKVSVLALGCWPFAGGMEWGDQSDDDSISAVREALDSGINLFDTAEGYGSGHSEQVLGRGLAGRRHEAVVATKVSPDHLSAGKVVEACERSLKNLGTDYVDLYQVHWPNWDVPLEETMGALERLKSDGKVRAIGVSNFGVRDLSDVLAVGEIVTDQMPYSLLWRAIESEIQPLCVARGVGIICYTPLAQGMLTGRYSTADDVPEGVARTRHFSADRPNARHDEPGVESELLDAIGAVRAIAEDVGEPMANVALAWARQQSGVTSSLVGARSAAEVRLNLPSLDVTISDATLAELSAATETLKQKLGRSPDMWHTPGRMR